MESPARLPATRWRCALAALAAQHSCYQRGPAYCQGAIAPCTHRIFKVQRQCTAVWGMQHASSWQAAVVSCAACTARCLARAGV